MLDICKNKFIQEGLPNGFRPKILVKSGINSQLGTQEGGGGVQKVTPGSPGSMG